MFNSSITPLIFIFITYYYFEKKKDPIFKASFIYIYIIIFVTLFFSLILYFWESNLYSRFLIFAFGICYQFCTFKNPIFSTHFYLGARLLAGLLSPPLDSSFSPPGCLYLLPSPSLLYSTLWISCVLGCGEHLGNWLLPRSLSFWFPLLSSWPPLSPSSLFSSLCITLWTSLRGSRLWRAHREVITG